MSDRLNHSYSHDFNVYHAFMNVILYFETKKARTRGPSLFNHTVEKLRSRVERGGFDGLCGEPEGGLLQFRRRL